MYPTASNPTSLPLLLGFPLPNLRGPISRLLAAASAELTTLEAMTYYCFPNMHQIPDNNTLRRAELKSVSDLAMTAGAEAKALEHE